MANIMKKVVSRHDYNIFRVLDKVTFFHVFSFWIIIILFFGLIFFFLSYAPNHSLKYGGELIIPDAEGFINSLYFSFITATSLGYGDVIPIGISKFLSGLEVIFGLIIYGVLISKLVGVKQEVLLEEVYDISYEDVIDRLRSGLYLFRADVNRILEKIETGTIQEREINDLWILFSTLDTTLINIERLVKPGMSEKYYHKTLDVFRLELFLNSIQLSMNKVIELVRTLKVHKIKWKNDLLLTSIEDDVRVVREVIEYQTKKSSEKKVIDKLDELEKTLNEIEREIGAGVKKKNKKKKHKKS
ncbi:hypothetical protein AYK26_07300 [Euryarchaeota archaeon SM23-78]|nr:MAG: hypothetical protein AYK26_07300 [Euryarchaeota archaeon SM23-78]MBW3000621.1 potassium channel family protein [Candidatus Woesearchaeota archaeon]